MFKIILLGLLLVSSSLLITACNKDNDNSQKTATAQSSQMKRGQEIYQQVCASCHATGLAGAPKFGDKTAWAPRIAMGIDALVESAMQGKGNMPAKGGQAGLDDKEIRAAVNYMVENSK